MPTPNGPQAGVQPASPQSALVMLRVIWAAMVMGQVIFVGVVVVFSKQMTPLPNPAAMILGIAAVAAALVFVPAGLFVRSELYKRSWEGSAVTPQGYMTANIVLLAMCEGATFFGLMVVMITHQWVPAVLGPVVAGVVFAMNFPNGRAMEADNPFASAGPSSSAGNASARDDDATSTGRR